MRQVPSLTRLHTTADLLMFAETYFRHVVDAERWRELVGVGEGDLVGGSFQGDFCPQEETVPQSVPV